MRLKFLGATGTVTGSRYLVTSDGGAEILVDCGLFQGLKDLRLQNWRPFSFDPARLEAVILTHAHLDHSGAVPLLIRQGFRGRVYCSSATRDLCEVLWPDAGSLQEEEARLAERHRSSRHHPPRPLFTREEAERALSFLEPVAWDRPVVLNSGVIFHLHYAGHILGAAHCVLQADETSLLFSGDIGRSDDPVLLAPSSLPGADYVVVESTYGDRRHPEELPELELAQALTAVLKRGGIAMLPAYAVGRSQMLLYLLSRLRSQQKIPSCPVYFDSPMAEDTNAVFRRHPHEHRLTRDEIAQMFQGIHFVKSQKESESLEGKKGPFIVLAGAGMLTGGRILQHIKAFAGDPKNALLLTGFQAAGTRGADLEGGSHELKIQGGHWPIRCEVTSLKSLSSHADQREILQWLGRFHERPLMTFVTHGEPDASHSLATEVQRQWGGAVRVPLINEEVKLERLKVSYFMKKTS